VSFALLKHCEYLQSAVSRISQHSNTDFKSVKHRRVRHCTNKIHVLVLSRYCDNLYNSKCTVLCRPLSTPYTILPQTYHPHLTNNAVASRVPPQPYPYPSKPLAIHANAFIPTLPHNLWNPEVFLHRPHTIQVFPISRPSLNAAGSGLVDNVIRGRAVDLSIKQIFGGLFVRLQKISIGGLVVKLAVAICFRLIRLAPGSIPGRCNYLFAVVRLWLRVFWWDERRGHVAYTASCTAMLAHRHASAPPHQPSRFRVPPSLFSYTRPL
jgi:hypothetical protein